MLGSVASWGAVPIFSKLPVSKYLSESLMALTVTSKTMESGTGKEGRREGRKEGRKEGGRSCTFVKI